MLHFPKNGPPIGGDGVRKNTTFMDVMDFQDLLVPLNGSLPTNAGLVILAHAADKGGTILAEETTQATELLWR